MLQSDLTASYTKYTVFVFLASYVLLSLPHLRWWFRSHRGFRPHEQFRPHGGSSPLRREERLGSYLERGVREREDRQELEARVHLIESTIHHIVKRMRRRTPYASMWPGKNLEVTPEEFEPLWREKGIAFALVPCLLSPLMSPEDLARTSEDARKKTNCRSRAATGEPRGIFFLEY